MTDMGASSGEDRARGPDGPQPPAASSPAGADPSREDMLASVIRDTLWMACRHAHGRQTYAVGMYNAAARKALALGVIVAPAEGQEPVFAIDGSLLREMSGLTPEEFEKAWQGWHPSHAVPNHCRDRDAAPRKAEGFEAAGQQPGPEGDRPTDTTPIGEKG